MALSYTTELKKPIALTQVQKEAWSTLRQANPRLYSPYFHLDYTQLMGELCPDVFVLCVMQEGQYVAFLPFQGKINHRGKIRNARAIGAPMTDYHGFISAQGTKIDTHAILNQVGIDVFHFSAMIDAQNAEGAYARQGVACTMMDLSGGAQSWRESRGSAYNRHLKSHRRRVRKAQEVGERRLVLKCRDQNVFDQLITWKHEQFSTTGKYDVLNAGWTLKLLEKLWARGLGERCHNTLRAEMHALYFGKHLVAVDFGVTDGSTFHSWMVGYDKERQYLAPGIQLLEDMIDNAAGMGYQRIDLGEGVEGYKRHYASESVIVNSGYIAASGMNAMKSKVYGAVENFGEAKLGRVGRLPGKVRRRYTQIGACETRFTRRAKAVLQAVKGAPLRH